MRTVHAVFFVCVLSSCTTAKRVTGYLNDNPSFAAKYCAENYPTKELKPTIDSTDYLQWLKEYEAATEPIIEEIDTIRTDTEHASNQNEAPCPEIVKTVYKTKATVLPAPPPIIKILPYYDSAAVEVIRQEYYEKEKKLNKTIRKERMFKNIISGAAIVLLFLLLLTLIIKRIFK